MPDILSKDEISLLLSATDTSDYENEEEQEDLILKPQGAGRLEHKEAAIIHGQAHATFTLTSGKELAVFSKSEGMLHEVDKALQEWLDAAQYAERRLKKKWWHMGRRRARVNMEMTRAQEAKYNYFRTLFQEPYIPEQDQELSPEDFMAMPLDLQTAIAAAYREANNVDDLLAAIWGKPITAKKNTSPAA